MGVEMLLLFVRQMMRQLSRVGLVAAAARVAPLNEPRVNLGELRPSTRYLVPALNHQRIHARRTTFRTGQHLMRTYHIDHVLVVISVVRLQ